MNGEIIVGLIASLATILGAVAYIGKRRSDAQLIEANAQLEKVKGENAVRLEETKGDSTIRDMLREQMEFNRQLQNNQAKQATTQERQFKMFMAALRKIRAQAREDYNVIRNVQRDENLAVTNLSNDVKRVNLEIAQAVNVVTKLPEEMNRVMEGMNTAIEAVKGIIESARELHLQTRQFFEQRLEFFGVDWEQRQAAQEALGWMRANFQAPKRDDCRWQVAKVQSHIGHQAWIQMMPEYKTDRTLLGRISDIEAEVCCVIEHTAWTGWIYLRRIEDDIEGWVDSRMVTITPVEQIVS